MILKRKTPEDLKREEFERQCREATQEVIVRAKENRKMDLYGAPWPYEKINPLNEDRTATRIRGSVFLWGALVFLLLAWPSWPMKYLAAAH